MFAWQVRNTAEESTIITAGSKQAWSSFWGKLTSSLKVSSYITTLRNSPDEKLVWCAVLAHPARHTSWQRPKQDCPFQQENIQDKHSFKNSLVTRKFAFA